MRKEKKKNWWKIVGIIALVLLLMNIWDNQVSEMRELRSEINTLKWKVESNENVAEYAHEKIETYHPSGGRG